MYGFVHSPVSLLMSALSDALGQPVDLEAEDDECLLEFDGGTELAFAHMRETQFLSIRSPITGAGLTLTPAILQQALALNYTSLPPGYCIALDEVNGQLMLVALVDADHTPPEHFLSLTAGFLELVPALREQCATTAEEDAQPWTGDFA